MARKAKKAKTSHKSLIDTTNPVIEPPEPVFTLFLNLPFELRALIWKHVSFQPRNVVISGLNEVEFGEGAWQRLILAGDTGKIKVYGYSSPTPPPTVLWVSKESRAEALKYYKLDFGISHLQILHERHISVSTPPNIYINWAADTLCLMLLDYEEKFTEQDPQAEDLLRRCVDNSLQKLAFNTRGANSHISGDPHSNGISWFCSELPSLKELTFFIRHPDKLLSRLPIEFKKLEGDLGYLVSHVQKDRLRDYWNYYDAAEDQEWDIYDALNCSKKEVDNSTPGKSVQDGQTTGDEEKRPFKKMKPIEVRAMALWQGDKDLTVEYFRLGLAKRMPRRRRF